MSSASASLSGVAHMDVDTADTEMDDEEVDQLDSDLNEDIDDAHSASSDDAYSKEEGQRVPGQTLLPEDRVENIIHADGTGGHMSREAMFMLSIATEEFIKRLAEAGYRQANVARRAMVSYRDLASATEQYREFMFLQDTIPAPLPLYEALERRAAKEKEIMDDDPAMSVAAAPPVPIIPAPPGVSQIVKTKGKSRQLNGRESNGSPSTSASIRRQRDNKGRWSIVSGQEDGRDETASETNGAGPDSNTTSRRSARTSRRSRQSSPPSNASVVNGMGPSTHSPAPAQLMVTSYPMDLANPSADEERWPRVQYTEPPSGYLEEHRLIFAGRNGVTHNPGRTIYSHHHTPNASIGP